MPEFNDAWSKWLMEGHYITYSRDDVIYYEHIIRRDLAHYVYDWPETIASGVQSTPVAPPYLELTKGYESSSGINQVWQMIFGIHKQVYIYLELPTDTHRHGLPKLVKPGSSSTWKVSHFEEWMSPFTEPSFITEHFMMRPGYDRILFEAYNPQDVTLTPRLNFFIAKLQTERLGSEMPGRAPVARSQRWAEVLDKLYRRVIPCRPITLDPVTAPAEAGAE